MTNRKGLLIAYMVGLASAFIWGSTFLLNKVITETEINPLGVMAIRTAVGSILIFLLIKLRVCKVNFRDKPIKPLIPIGIAQPCIYGIFEMYGISQTSASEASIIAALSPVLALVLASVVFHDYIAKKQIVFIGLSFLGVVVVTVFGGEFSLGGKLVGYLLLVGCVLCASVYNVLVRRNAERYSSFEITAVMTVAGCIFFNTIIFLQGDGIKTYTMAFENINILVPLLYLGAFGTLGAFFGYNYVLSKLPLHIASTLVISTMTLVGVVLGIVVLGEPFGIATGVGTGLMVLGIIGVNFVGKGHSLSLEEEKATHPKKK